MRIALIIAGLVASGAAGPLDAAPGSSASSASTAVVGTPGEAIMRGPQAGQEFTVRVVAKRANRIEDISVLGDVKLVRAEEGQARLRIDGAEETLRPGMFLKTDRVKSIAPERIVLVRPAEVDEAQGEVFVVIDILAGGRTRVRTYATRDRTAKPPRPVE